MSISFFKNDNIIQSVYNNIIRYFHCSKRIKFVLAFSGGLDSIVLLDIISIKLFEYIKKYNLKHINFMLRAVYIDHGITEKSQIWIDHCMYECKARKILFKYIKNTWNQNILLKNINEGYLRKIRYQMLSKDILNEEILLTAHHFDDQVETYMLALKRGSGPLGLSGMKIFRDFRKENNNKYNLFRPLLYSTKKQIKEYAIQENLRWIEDDDNENLKFDRNFFRLKILPLLNNRWPKFSDAVFRSSQICAEQELLIDELLQKDLNSVIKDNINILCFVTLINMSKARRNAILRRWLFLCNVRYPSQKKLLILWHEVALSNDNAKPKLILDYNKMVVRKKNCLYILTDDNIKNKIV